MVRLMYDLLIKLEHDLDYRKYKIEDLKELKKILEELKEPTKEIRAHKIKEIKK